MKYHRTGNSLPSSRGHRTLQCLLAAALGETHTVGNRHLQATVSRVPLSPAKPSRSPARRRRRSAGSTTRGFDQPVELGGVGRMIRERRPDMLVFKYWLPFFGPCFGTIARMAGPTGIRGSCASATTCCRTKGGRSISLFTRYAFAAVDAFIVQSGTVERDLQRLLPRARYRLVPHPVYNIFGPPATRRRPASGWPLRRSVDSLLRLRAALQGFQVLLQAMPHLLASLPVRLLVVGEFYDDEQSYREQIRTSGLEQR